MQGTAEKIADVATYGGATSAVVFGLTAVDFAALAGVVIGIVGLAMQFWFRWQHLQLERRRNAPPSSGK